MVAITSPSHPPTPQNPENSVLSGLKCLQGRLRDLCYLETILRCSLSLAEHEKVIVPSI